jgi:hypothetical protein
MANLDEDENQSHAKNAIARIFIIIVMYFLSKL